MIRNYTFVVFGFSLLILKNSIQINEENARLMAELKAKKEHSNRMTSSIREIISELNKVNFLKKKICICMYAYIKSLKKIFFYKQAVKVTTEIPVDTSFELFSP